LLEQVHGRGGAGRQRALLLRSLRPQTAIDEEVLDSAATQRTLPASQALPLESLQPHEDRHARAVPTGVAGHGGLPDGPGRGKGRLQRHAVPGGHRRRRVHVVRLSRSHRASRIGVSACDQLSPEEK